MNIVRNEKLVKRNRRLAQIAMLASLLIMAAASFVAFQYQEWSFYAVIAVLAVGFPLSQIGLFMTNRWGRNPRPDELLDKALKGLDKKYSIYHFASPVSHLLLGPAGVWVLFPYFQSGEISYAKGRWQQKRSGLLFLYLKIFAQEGLGRPDLEVLAEVDKLKKVFNKLLPEGKIPPINAALVFTHENATINVPENESPPAETVHARKLKDLLRKAAKSEPLSLEQVKTIQDSLFTS